jgi:hypothetical protein
LNPGLDMIWLRDKLPVLVSCYVPMRPLAESRDEQKGKAHEIICPTFQKKVSLFLLESLSNIFYEKV